MEKLKFNTVKHSIGNFLMEVEELELPSTPYYYWCKEHKHLPTHDYPFLTDLFGNVQKPAGHEHYVPICPLCGQIPKMEAVNRAGERL